MKIFINRGAGLVLGAAFLAAAPMAVAQNYNLDPTFGVVTIVTGYEPDPNWVAVLAGGDIRGVYQDYLTGAECAGHFADAPDFRVHYQAGPTFPLAFFADAQADTVLLVNTPDGAWHCNDDTVGLNPAIEFATPLSGQYDIWVGTYAPSNGDYPPAQLGITEIGAYNDLDPTYAFFGADDRQVMDTSQAPWNMIGLVEFNDGSCTGVLVGPSTIVTAGHCILDSGTMSQALSFEAGYSDGRAVASSRITGNHIPQGWRNGERDGMDFAFLFLAEPLGDQLGFMDVGPLTPEEVQAMQTGAGPEILQAGYSYDQGESLTGHIGCPFVGLGNPNEIYHECDTLSGDSGSPLFIDTGDGRYRIIGVESHTRPNPDPGAEYDLNVAMYAEAVARELAAVSQGGTTAAPVDTK